MTEPVDPRAEELERLAGELLPKVRELMPDLSEADALEAARRIAAYRLSGEVTLIWPDPR